MFRKLNMCVVVYSGIHVEVIDMGSLRASHNCGSHRISGGLAKFDVNHKLNHIKWVAKNLTKVEATSCYQWRMEDSIL